MTREEYINDKLKSARYFLARGTDALGDKIISPSAYMRGARMRVLSQMPSKAIFEAQVAAGVR